MKIKGKKILFVLGTMLMPALSMSAQQVVPAETCVEDVFIDLTLEKAIEIALSENPTIKVADKDIELKKVANTEAWQSLLPTVDASLALSNSIKVAAIKTGDGQEFKMGRDNSVTATGAATLALPLFAPAVYQNMKLTKEDIILAQEKARSSRLDLINQVTKAYYAALLAQDSYEVVKKSYDVTKENYDLVAKKFDVGKVSEYDKISAEVQLRNMNSTVVSTQTGLTLAQLQLKVLMGIDSGIKININDKLSNYEGRLSLPNLNDQADLSENSALKQLDMNGGLLERTRKLLKTNFMPTVAMQLQGQYLSYSNENWNVFKYKFSPAMTLALSVSIPIYHASYFTKLKSNKIQIAQLADTRINTERQLKMAAESYKRNMASTIAQVASNSEAVKQAAKAVMISSKRYEVGHGTILELNQSETAQTQAELTYVQSIYDYLTNQADLDYTLGRETYLK